jgi:hypothetical protein
MGQVVYKRGGPFTLRARQDLYLGLPSSVEHSRKLFPTDTFSD